MEWQLAILVILGSLIVLLASGMPVAFCFLVVDAIGILIWWGGEPGMRQLILSAKNSLSSFTLLPIPLFILMGEVMFQSGLGTNMMEALGKWMGRLPGRLALLAVGGGTLFATLSGSAMASAAMLGSVLLPEMEKHGYKKSMSLGPILGAGGLAVMIPPSAMAVVLGSIAQISIGRLLMGIIMPGLLMAVLFAAYIILRCWLQPSVAPPYEVAASPLSEKLRYTVRDILPLGSIVFMIIGLMLLGVATATEAAATGTLMTFILAAAYKKLNWGVLKKSALASVEITVMVFFIIMAAAAFGQILAFSGASTHLSQLATTLPVAPMLIIVLMMILLLILGCFINTVPIMMITLPIFMPVVQSLGFNVIWFGVIYMITMEMAPITPPFGLVLFVVKAIAPPGTTMADVYRAGLAFIGLDLLALALVMIFPQIALWLPGLMQRSA
ncbi:MAG: TRAP transporter large permease subunit [Chloroflexota bacterium]|nr:TRAP transporter large permease subunit [Chloroflexota bacterium]